MEDLKGGKRNMRKIFGMFILASVLLTLGFVSAEKCGGLDLCTWTTDTGYEDMGLPLSSGPYSGCTNLNPDEYTYWPLGTQAVPSTATVTCNFDASSLDLNSVMVFISIDNDVVSCTLNGEELPGTIKDSEGCAILDPMVPEPPRTGYVSSQLSANDGENTLVCVVEDRGAMAYFDACVVGTEEVLEEYCGDGITNGEEECDDGNVADGDGCSANCTIEQDVIVPEFGAIIAVLTVMGALGTFFVIRRR